jgi:hypothetical protein
MSSTFERPVADLAKIVAAWEEWERGTGAPGKTLTDMKKAGLAEVFSELQASGWKPAPQG